MLSLSTRGWHHVTWLLEPLCAVCTKILVFRRLVDTLLNRMHDGVLLLNDSFVAWQSANLMVAGFILNHALVGRFIQIMCLSVLISSWQCF